MHRERKLSETFQPLLSNGSCVCGSCNGGNELKSIDRFFDQLFNFSNSPLDKSLSKSNLSNNMLNKGLLGKRLLSNNNSQEYDLLCNYFIEKNGQYECEIPVQQDMIDNLQINEKNRMIRLNATKETNDNGYSFKSNLFNSWSRSLSLPINAIENSTVASYQDGKLKLVAQIKSI